MDDNNWPKGIKKHYWLITLFALLSKKKERKEMASQHVRVLKVSFAKETKISSTVPFC